MFQEVLLCATAPSVNTGTGLLALHDIQTGTSLASFKQTSAAAHCVSHVETKNGLGGILLAAQSDKALLNIFSFQKDQLMSKMVIPEKLCCIAVDSRGEFCAGGTTNGRLYLWEVASGILFSSFEAHYRRVSVLRFTHDGASLVSTSDDSSVSVWSMSRLLDEELQAEIPAPYCSFTEHTLPVTDVSCGVGLFPSCRIFTASLDHSVKIWDLSTRCLLSSILFPQPITVLTVDPSERFLFSGSQDGSIHQVNLFRRRTDATNMRGVEALGGGGMSDVIRLDDDETAHQRLISAGQPITALSLSMTSSQLLAGTASGQIHIYDVESHQLLRSINTYRDKGLGITSLATFLKPPDLFGHVSLGDGGAAARDADPIRPVAPFQRTKDASARQAHEVSIMLPIQPSTTRYFQVSKAPCPSTEELLREHQYFVQVTDGANTSNVASLNSRVSELEGELTKLREQLGRAKGLNDAMWEGVVQKVLNLDGQTDGDTDKEVGERSRKRSRTVK
ncbi:WD40-repeat-containing domain protein [Gautieria morchelliformis]|nr:WD40-repeat-containing domain protein [Gautieria morchelliformis]